MSEKEQKKVLILDDPPSCAFLEKNMKLEEEAIQIYMDESERTNDEELKTEFKYIAEQEMDHLRKLRTMHAKMKCKTLKE